MPFTKAAITTMHAATVKAAVHATTEREGERRLSMREAWITAQVEEKAARAAPTHPRMKGSRPVSASSGAAWATVAPISSPSEAVSAIGARMSGASSRQAAASKTPPATPTRAWGRL